ncbi:MAG: hypothetical protein GY861_17570 [bacterium]|nr:hypothetical protein [bacterium]
MSYKTVTSFAELDATIRKMSLQLIAAVDVSMLRIALIGDKTAKQVAEQKKWRGTLISMINLTRKTGKVVVTSTAPYSEEIEEGLTNAEFRTYAENPSLRTWVMEHWDWVPAKGILVHTKGIHFMKKGWIAATAQSNRIIGEEISKIHV